MKKLISLHSNRLLLSWKVLNNQKHCFYSLTHQTTPELLEEIAFQNHYKQHSSLETYEQLNNPDNHLRTLLYERQSFLESDYITEKREPKTFSDKFAKGIVTCIKSMIELYFGKNYIQHAMCLEAIASIPPLIMGIIKHFSYLWKLDKKACFESNELFEEAENERMHLMVWLHVCKPSRLDRLLVFLSQVSFAWFIAGSYLISPKFVNKLLEYLEEASIDSYTRLLKEIENGRYDQVCPPMIALEYYHMVPHTVTLKDVVLSIRADEVYHRDFHYRLQ